MRAQTRPVPSGTGRWRAWALPAALALPPAVYRLALLFGTSAGGASETGAVGGALRGLTLDLALALLAVPIVAGLAAVSRWLALPAVVAWWALHTANDQHVRALDALARPEHAHYLLDPTFVLGSALRWRAPALALGALAASLALAWLAVRRPIRPPWRWLLALGAALAVTLALWPAPAGPVHWRHGSVLVEAARGLARPAASEQMPGDGAHPLLAELMRPDLDGRRRLPPSAPGTDVLLIVLEGVSGGYLPTLAAAHGIVPDLEMPDLDALARDHLAFATVVNPQRQTNRGEYAILCGDVPRLDSGEPRMTAVARGAAIGECLPARLRRAGYRTVYAQAAPLAFMLKDRFMPRAGFAEVLGADDIEHAAARTFWGVDDRAFFDYAATLVETLAGGEQPFFLTLLTVGTHHPFTVPGARAGEPLAELARALAYLDGALADFLDRLARSGTLSDALVIVTGDESLGLGAAFDDATRALSQSWGFAVVLTPGRAPERVDEPYLLSDLALSILDQLGLGATPGSAVGRSLLRRYRRPRTAVFANVYQQTLGGFFDRRDLYLCPERPRPAIPDGGCVASRPPAGRLFAAERAPIPVHAPRVAALRAVQARSREGAARGADDGRLPLVGARRIPVRPARPHQIVFSGQALAFPAGSELEVRIALAVEGTGGLRLEHDFVAAGRVAFDLPIPPLRAGDRLDVRYRLASVEPLSQVQARLRAKAPEGAPVLAIEEAWIARTPLPRPWPDDAALEPIEPIVTISTPRP